MILLDTTTRRLQILLGGVGAIPFLASYVDITTATQSITAEAANTGVTNGVTPVDLIGVPASGIVRQVKLIWIKNTSGGAVVATIRYDDNGISRDFAFSLDNNDLIQYTDGEGFRLFDSTGKLKIQTSAASGSLTVEEVDGVPSVANVTTLRFDQADGFIVSNPGAGIARVDLTAGGASTVYRRWAMIFGD